jgi:hypothetical protein
MTERNNFAHSMQLPQRKSDLLRQLMRVTHQEMGDLETSAGGEKNLLSMLQNFFRSRNLRKL